jgi:hypothetical protein
MMAVWPPGSREEDRGEDRVAQVDHSPSPGPNAVSGNICPLHCLGHKEHEAEVGCGTGISLGFPS